MGVDWRELPHLPDYIPISPMTLTCPRCKAAPGVACQKLRDEVELIHIERIEAAAEKDLAAKKARLQ
jgi:hypothetical protein